MIDAEAAAVSCDVCHACRAWDSAHLHGRPGCGFVPHGADLVRLGADKLKAVLIADLHKVGVLRQEAITLQATHLKADSNWPPQAFRLPQPLKVSNPSVVGIWGIRVCTVCCCFTHGLTC